MMPNLIGFVTSAPSSRIDGNVDLLIEALMCFCTFFKIDDNELCRVKATFWHSTIRYRPVLTTQNWSNDECSFPQSLTDASYGAALPCVAACCPIQSRISAS